MGNILREVDPPRLGTDIPSLEVDDDEPVFDITVVDLGQNPEHFRAPPVGNELLFQQPIQGQNGGFQIDGVRPNDNLPVTGETVAHSGPNGNFGGAASSTPFPPTTPTGAEYFARRSIGLNPLAGYAI